MHCFEVRFNTSTKVIQKLMLILVQEVYAYLSAIERTWKYILGTDIRPDQLDESTVVALQMQIPDSSTDDCDAICRLFDNNKVFPLVEDQHRRKRLSERVLNCKRILSFRSFFDDFRYIRPCFESLSVLLPEGSWRKDKSFRQVFEHNWIRNTQHDNGKHDFLRCYIELWLFAMREFPSLSSSKTSMPLHDKARTNKLIRPRLTVPKKEVEFAYNASFLGFHTCEIESIKRMHPSGIQQVGPNRLPPAYSCDDRPLPQTARSNRPSVDSYQEDKDFLHFIYMIQPNPARKKKYATRIAVTQDIVQCCWMDTERWISSPRRSQYRRFPIPISTNEVARHVGSGPKVAKRPTTKPPQRRSFNLGSFRRALYTNSYQELIANPEDNSVPTKMKFSNAFVETQGMKDRIITLPTAENQETRADQEFDHVAEALRLLQNSSSGSGEATGASLGPRNVLGNKDGCDDPMDMDLPNENHASQEYDDEITTVHSLSLNVRPLNVAVRRDLEGKDDKSNDRTFLPLPPNDTTRASSIYSLYDGVNDGISQDATQVRVDDGASNIQAPYQHLHETQRDTDDSGKRILLQHTEREIENAVHTSSQDQLIEAIHEEPDIQTVTESSLGTMSAPATPQGSAGRHIDSEAELFDDPSSVKVSTHDGPTDDLNPDRLLKSHGNVSSLSDSTSGDKSHREPINKRSAIRDSDGLQEVRYEHDTTIKPVYQNRDENELPELNSSGKRKENVELTNDLNGVKYPLKENRNRITQLPLKPEGAMLLDSNNDSGTPSVNNGAPGTTLGKRPRTPDDRGQKKYKPRKIESSGTYESL